MRLARPPHAPLQPSAGGLSLAGQILRTGCGSLLLVWGIIITAGMSIVLLANPSGLGETVAKVVSLILLGLLPAGVGGFLVNSIITGRRKSRQYQDEQLILQVAAGYQGRVTVAQVTRASQLPLATAEQYLDAMARLGHATMDLTDDGNIVYRFPGLIPAQQPIPADTRAEAFEQVELDTLDPRGAFGATRKR